MASVMKKYAEEMWKRGGVRMVVLTGYKDEEQAWLTSWYVDENLMRSTKYSLGPASISTAVSLMDRHSAMSRMFTVLGIGIFGDAFGVMMTWMSLPKTTKVLKGPPELWPIGPAIA